MIYPDIFEKKIGFDEIKNLLAANCQSDLGREIVSRLVMLTEPDEITQHLHETNELRDIMEGSSDLPEMFFYDMRPAIQRIHIEGSHVEEEDLGKLKKSLDTLHSWLKIIRAENDGSPLYPALNGLSIGVFTFIAIASVIDKTIDKYGKIRDDASPELMRIRRELRSSEGSVNRKLHSILKSVKDEGLVAKDVTPTFREGRLVIPVSPTLKRRLNGIVHDESATGKTIYIEPQEVVEANNHIRELESEEKREIIQILKHITMLVRPNTKELLRAFKFLGNLEFVRAKVRFAQQTDSICPQILPYPFVDWFKAQHPLLKLSLQRQGKEIVPLDIKLNKKNRILIISGPNAGGKSVCLKTVGLLQYMMQCGLPVPVGEDSRMGIFEKIGIDIGDEQSIEDDLSTYSSHLLNMKNMMKLSSPTTLLLIDEFGGGTEPTIGGAIAEAILKRFVQRNSYGIITTHYQNLKHFAEENEGVVNGAMLYDRQKMQALFQLQIGNPGSSFAIEIARKIGIPEDIIADATQLVGKDYVNADKYLLDIVRDKRYWEGKRQTIHSQEKHMDETIRRYEQEMEDLKRKRKEIIQGARQQAEEIIQNSNAVVENTIREIREAQAEKERTREIRNELSEFREKLNETKHDEQDEMIERKMRQIVERRKRQEQRRQEKNNSQISQDTQKPLLGGLLGALQDNAQKDCFAIGEPVKIKGTTAIGTVEKVSGKKITVQFGMVRSTIDASKLENAKTQPKARQDIQMMTYVSRETQDRIRETNLRFQPEIDIRGMRGDEALDTITHYMDDAILVSAGRVRILHGTGNGILRQLIRQYLNTLPQVRSARDEDVRFGGAGITVVELR